MTDIPTITINKRYMRSQQLLYAVMQVVDEHLCTHGPRNARREVMNELFDLFWENGVEIVTDADRAAAGLRPRDKNGLTGEELYLLEEKMLEARRRPVIADFKL